MKIKSLIIVLFVSCISQLTYSQLSPSQIKQIDSIFISWNTPNHPGGAVGVMKDNKVIYSKAFGLASLEYLVPNTQNTLFNIASVSKQFTAMGIVLLHLQGKLSVDDDIRKYLPELYQFKEIITIRHMLHHTSGLRSLHAMLGMAGWRGDDSRTNADLNRFMLKQKDLNFKPGDEYLYCNTGFMLMVNIIEKVTGEEFSSWMNKSVFEPLGMHDTYIENKYNRVVANNATSYNLSKEGIFDREVEFWGYVGSGNMHSTTNDLLTWSSNFYTQKPGWEEAFKMMQTIDYLNDGSLNKYAFGINIDSYLGHKRVQHGGSIGGFRAFIGTYPDEKISIAVLTNFSASSSGSKANQIAGILLPKLDGDERETEKKHNSSKQINLSNDQLKKYENHYWNDKENYARKIFLKNDTLRYSRSATNESPIVPIGNDEFQMLNVTVDLKVKFIINGKRKSMIVTEENDQSSTFQGFESKMPTREELLSYTGKFYSQELETMYDIYIKNDTLSFHHARHGDSKMKVLKKDVLEGGWPLLIVKYKRDKKGKVEGLFATNGRARNVWFKKQ